MCNEYAQDFSCYYPPSNIVQRYSASDPDSTSPGGYKAQGNPFIITLGGLWPRDFIYLQPHKFELHSPNSRLGVGFGAGVGFGVGVEVGLELGLGFRFGCHAKDLTHISQNSIIPIITGC